MSLSVYNRLVMLVLYMAGGMLYAQQKLYDTQNMPIVDMHTHLNGKEEYKQCVKTMDAWGGAVSITLNPNDPSLVKFSRDSLRGRILLAGRGRSFTPEQIQVMKDRGLVGLKSHMRYHTPVSDIPGEQIEKMGTLNFPFIALHVADPPEDTYYEPDKFMKAQQNAERVIHRYPETNFIMAHGFYLTNRDSDIDSLRAFLERNPNLYVDIVCSKWWDAPQPSYVKLRKLLIDFKDRFMFGTDFKVTRHAPAFRFLREKLETAKPLTFGMNGGPGPGLALPLDVLNRIYYWNAARVIPGVKEALEGLGYEISNVPPRAVPVEPGLSYNPPAIKVLRHNSTMGVHEENFAITIDLSAYDRALEGRLDVMDKKKNKVKTLYRGVMKGVRHVAWDGSDEKGRRMGKGMYRLWLILEDNKSVESNFNMEE